VCHVQVECLRSGLLGASKEDFSARYCDRRLVPQSMSSIYDGRKKWDNSGVYDVQLDPGGEKGTNKERKTISSRIVCRHVFMGDMCPMQAPESLPRV